MFLFKKYGAARYSYAKMEHESNEWQSLIRANGSPLLVKLTLSPDCLAILKSIGEVDESRVAMKPEILVPVSPI